ncbi:MAG: M3 family oligoendopeptidase [Oscillospiraceae bacterium]|nr:M3 family oligoendopeptidase [Candidatus Limimonas egerieequi]
MKLQDMVYERPNVEELKVQIKGLVDEFKAASTFEEADAVRARYDELFDHYETLATLCYIRHSVNTKDEYYDKEQQWNDEQMPIIQEYSQMFTEALLESKFRPQFEDKYGDLLFVNAEMEKRTFKPEIIADLQAENKLVTDYEKLLASAQIDFEGKKMTISELLPYKQDADDKLRLDAWTAEGNFYMENKAELDRLYDDLVKVRDKMGKALGHSNYIPLGYDRMTRNSYTKDDVDRFRKAVVKYIVPLADKIYRDQAKRIGKDYPMNYADAALMFRDGMAKPQGTADDILAHGKKFYHELSPETTEFIDFMYDNDLLDVLSKDGKAVGGYCTEIPDYQAEFIFANFNGTADDVETVTHEAGHAFAGYVAAREIDFKAYRNPTMESCEIHSMSMEFFAWKWAEGFFGPKTEKFKYQHLAGALKFIPYGTMVDHFQHIAYEHPELTPKQRDEEWKKLTAIYMPWIKMDEIPFFGDGAAWQRQHHIYSYPFYYIDYCFAQTVALEFWAFMQKDFDAAWKAYLKLVRLGGTKTFNGLVDAAGLDNPFDEEAFKKICEIAGAWLDDFDESKLS